MQRILVSIIIIILIAIAGYEAYLLSAEKKDTGDLPNQQGQQQNQQPQNSDILVSLPQPDQEISNPLKIEGQARGPWYFEAVFNAKLFDTNGNDLGIAILTAKSDWMTTDFVPFEGSLEFKAPQTETGMLRFLSANPSGLPEHQKQFEVPIKFSGKSLMTVKAFFNNSRMDPEISCNKVFPVERRIEKTPAPARKAIEEMLKGPTNQEKNDGFFTSINEGVKIQSLVVSSDGTAKIDFDNKLQEAVGGSCRVSAIRAQITETLKQFPTVKNVIISVNGNAEEALQP